MEIINFKALRPLRNILFGCFLIIPFCSFLKGQSCDVDGKKHYTFEDAKKVFDKNQCGQCHYKGSFQSLWTFDTYEDLFRPGNCGEPAILHGNVGKSLLIDKLNGGPTGCGNAMPLGDKKISDSDLLILESWIELGAPEKCISDFQQVKQLLITSNCQQCHQKEPDWHFNDYAALFRHGVSSDCAQDVIVRYNATKSLLYQKLSGNTTCGAAMPPNGPPVSPDALVKIRDWINAGAPETSRVLPVSLTDFHTQSDSKGNIHLFWQTASEVNTSHFEIEFSRDGYNFSYEARVQATGFVNTGASYHYVFNRSAVGYNYFRLRIVDFDNTFNYSSVRVERVINQNEIFKVMPNPVMHSQQLFIEWYPTDDREKAQMRIMSIDGHLIRNVVLANGINSLDVSDLHPGMYYISIEDFNATRIVRKISVIDP